MILCYLYLYLSLPIFSMLRSAVICSFFFFLMIRRPPISPLFPYPPLFRSAPRSIPSPLCLSAFLEWVPIRRKTAFKIGGSMGNPSRPCQPPFRNSVLRRKCLVLASKIGRASCRERV